VSQGINDNTGDFNITAFSDAARNVQRAENIEARGSAGNDSEHGKKRFADNSIH
jgi:hypothetical protein